MTSPTSREYGLGDYFYCHQGDPESRAGYWRIIRTEFVRGTAYHTLEHEDGARSGEYVDKDIDRFIAQGLISTPCETVTNGFPYEDPDVHY